jgi:hypothetical protein
LMMADVESVSSMISAQGMEERRQEEWKKAGGRGREQGRQGT